jgi:NAD(P)-dependent dehydrogenase (short-subunit alcohol dehydrogenase family)
MSERGAHNMPDSGKEFAGLTAIITGAASGIGLATARLLHRQGATIFGLDLNQGELTDFATWIYCDVSTLDSVTKAFAEVKAKTNIIDILINNAAVGSIGTVESESEENWEKIFNINVFSVARVTKAALPLLRNSKVPAIVNTCSIAATAGIPNRIVYAASKGAIRTMTFSMACDLLKDRIRVNCVNPGTADTPWVQRLLSQADDPVAERVRLEARQPWGRLVSAEEVASSVAYLASPRQGSTTATEISVDGGMQNLRVPK